MIREYNKSIFIIFLLFVLVKATLSLTHDFTSKIVLSEPSMINGGAVNGLFFYDFDGGYYKLDFQPNHSVTELRRFIIPASYMDVDNHKNISCPVQPIGSQFSIAYGLDYIEYHLRSEAHLLSLMINLPDCINPDTVEISGGCSEYNVTRESNFPTVCSPNSSQNLKLNIGVNPLCDMPLRVRIPGTIITWGQEAIIWNSLTTLDTPNCSFCDWPVFSCAQTSVIRKMDDDCENETTYQKMPLFYSDPEEYVYQGNDIIDGIKCDYYIKKNGSVGSLDELWLRSDNITIPCRAIYFNGMDFIFKDVEFGDVSLMEEFDSYQNEVCLCRKPIDLVLAIQESTQSTFGDFENTKELCLSLLKNYFYSPNLVRGSILLFNTNSIETALNFNEGINNENIQNSVQSLNCKAPFNGNSSDSCFNSTDDDGIISLFNRKDDIFNSSRVYSSKVLILVLQNLSEHELDQYFKNINFTIFIIAFGDRSNFSPNTLSKLSQNQYSHIIFIEDYLKGLPTFKKWSTSICGNNHNYCDIPCCGFCLSTYCQSPDLCKPPNCTLIEGGFIDIDLCCPPISAWTCESSLHTFSYSIPGIISAAIVFGVGIFAVLGGCLYAATQSGDVSFVKNSNRSDSTVKNPVFQKPKPY